MLGFMQKELDIDWAFYKERLNPNIVDIFESSYKCGSGLWFTYMPLAFPTWSLHKDRCR